MDIKSFLAARIDYLKNVSDLGDGWISSGAKSTGLAPSKSSCDCAIGILKKLTDIPIIQSEFSLSSIIMGPLVTGGICIEVRIASLSMSVFFSIENNGIVDLSLLSSQENIEVSTTFAKVWDEFFRYFSEASAVAKKF